MNDESLKSRFNQLNSRRGEVLDRAERAARLTIPALHVADGHTEQTKLPTPYQGTGARAVNSLASKIVLALFPPGHPFFTLALSAAAQRELGEDSKVASALSDIEQITMEKFESTRIREVNARAGKTLLVAGNYLIHVVDAERIRGFGLRHFVVNRDSMGLVVECLLKESVSMVALSPELRKLLEADPEFKQISEKPDREIELYTGMIRRDGKYHVHQELNLTHVPGSDSTHPLTAPPLIPIRWTSVDGEDYGRGMVNEYEGEFKSLDDLRRDILKASANAAKIVWLRKPGAVLKKLELSTARSGDVLDGNLEDVRALTLDKYGDFRVSLEQIRDITVSLREAFLMNSAVQRAGERVTAEEIRYVAQELETALGGVYSLLSEEWQRPLISRYLDVLQRSGDLPKLPAGATRMTISTGLSALGRSLSMNKALGFWQAAVAVLGPEEAVLRLNSTWLLTELAIGHGISEKKAVIDDAVVQQRMQQKQLQAAVEKSVPGVAQEMTKGMNASG